MTRPHRPDVRLLVLATDGTIKGSVDSAGSVWRLRTSAYRRTAPVALGVGSLRTPLTT